MGLTWEQFLKLATVITNLWRPIAYFNIEHIGIKEKNRRVAAAAINYKEFFNDFKYMRFMEKVRTSFSNVIIIFQIINKNRQVIVINI